MKKKAVAAMLIMCMAVSAAACGKSSDTESINGGENNGNE